MPGLFKKAMGLFVEFEEEKEKSPIKENLNLNTPNIPPPNFSAPKPVISKNDLDKFEKHFDKLFDQVNLPGPDYFEFWKMMETLEAHIPDEKSRISAVYASLAIQGITKQKLLETAEVYKQAVEKDKFAFIGAVNQKNDAEVLTRKNTLQTLEKKIADHAALIQKLTAEISESQVKITAIKTEVAEEENKIANSKSSYNTACDALLSKITSDIEKIKTTL